MPSDTIPIELMDARELQDALAEAIGYVKNDERVPEARRPAGEYWHWSKGDGVHFELWAFCPVPDFLSASALGFVARHTPPMWNTTVSSVPRRDNTVEWFCSATKRPALPPGAPVTQRDSAVARGATEILARARLVLKIAREDLDAAAWLAGVRTCRRRCISSAANIECRGYAPSMPGQLQQPPDRPRAAVNFQVSDTEPFLEFINRLVALQDRLDKGQITSVREAADELGKILALNEGHRL